MDIEPKIRAARSSDAGAMKRCVELAYRHYIPRMGKPPGPMLDDYAEVIRQHGAFVVEEQGGIIGILVLIRTGDGMLLDNVAVHPGHQGKGVGRRLLELAEAQTRARGLAHLDLYTNQCMTENIAIYKALGYVETGCGTGKGYNRVCLRKAV